MDVQTLRAKGADLKACIRDLTNERQQLAPYAINGDARGPEARARIAVIDTERAAAISDLETVEDALRSPEYQHAGLVQRLDDAFARRLAAHQHALISQLQSKYFLIAQGTVRVDDLTFDGPQRVSLADLPRAIAAGLTRETATAEDLAGVKRAVELNASNPNHDDSARIDELTVRLAAHQRHTQELLASTPLPAIPEAVADKAGLPRQGHASNAGNGVAVAGGFAQ